MEKKLFFKIELKIEDYYYGDGIIRVQDNEFEGYIAFDYICGVYNNTVLYVTLLERSFQTDEPQYKTNFVTQPIDFELPNMFLIYNEDENLEACINFKQKVCTSNQRFEASLNEVKHFFTKANRE